MRMAKVSVICPVYNAERFLRRSVDTVLSQTLRDIELILVDDGSTDGSGMICDEYASSDTRVKVVHKSNGGVSSARQAGMDQAEGEYFIHIDSDDWADKEWLEKMYVTALRENADVVCCDFYQVFKDRRELSRQCHPEYSQKMIAEAVAGGSMAHSLWNKLIRRSVFNGFGLRFPAGMTVAEDALVCQSLFIRGVRCAFCEGVYYYYDRFSNVSSLTRSKYRSSLDSVCLCVTLLEKTPGDEDIRRLSVRTMKGIAKLKAFHCLSAKEFVDLYKETNGSYIARNIFKVNRIEGYVALGLVIRGNKAALWLYNGMRRLFGKDAGVTPMPPQRH